MFQWILIAALAISLLTSAMTRVISRRASHWLRVASLASCLMQLIVQGPRLELVPAYLVSLVLALLVLIDVASGGPKTEAEPRRRSRVAKVIRWTAITGATVSLLVAAILSAALHSLDYPLPTGPYAIGTSELRFTDTLREELFTEAPDDAREILVRVSYPAMKSGALDRLPHDTIPSIPALIVGALWPNTITASWGAMATHAKRNAPLAAAEQPYPVLIFSHGMGAYSEQNTALVEHLASHGYVVMAINHPFLSSGFRFADGSMIGLDLVRRPNPFPNNEEQDREEDAIQMLLSDGQHSSTTEQESLLRQLAAVNPRSNERWASAHRLMSDDQRSLLDNLSSLPADSIFSSRLDLARVGVFGMSSGGTASHVTCALDQRCRAGLNMDGFWPLLLDLSPLSVPFMHMSREGNPRHTIAHERSQAASYVVRVEGSEHLSFTDDVLTLHQLQRVGTIGSEIVGTIDGERMVQIINEYALAFFNASLQARHEPLLAGPAGRYPDVTLLAKP